MLQEAMAIIGRTVARQDLAAMACLAIMVQDLLEAHDGDMLTVQQVAETLAANVGFDLSIHEPLIDLVVAGNSTHWDFIQDWAFKTLHGIDGNFIVTIQTKKGREFEALSQEYKKLLISLTEQQESANVGTAIAN